MCEEFLARCEKAGLQIIVTHTLRSMEEQAHLYAKGRELPGPIVTNAPPGSSPHNFGAAFDIAQGGPGPLYPKEDDPFWEQVHAIGDQVGLKWGGTFHSIMDRPHFERPTWRVFRSSSSP